MFNSYEELIKNIEEKNIRIIDFKVITLEGKWNHLSIPRERVNGRLFTDGIGFDGSSYGYSSIENSDMCFIPDYTTAFIDSYCKENTLSMIGNIYTVGNVEERFSGDPRYIAEKANEYLKVTNIADEFVIAPEFEFYIFDNMGYEEQNNYLSSHTIDISNIKAENNSEEHISSDTEEMKVKGNTTFKEVLDWGVSEEAMETIIDAKLPNTVMTIKDYCAEKEIEFSIVKTAIQQKIDEAK